MNQGIINSAEQTLESFRFENECSSALEKFSSKFQKVCNTFSYYGIEVVNGDIVE